MTNFENLCSEIGIKVEKKEVTLFGDTFTKYIGLCEALHNLICEEIDKDNKDYLQKALNRFYKAFPYMKKTV